MKYFRIESNGTILCIHALEGSTITIGRSPDNTICISDPRISRNHVRIDETETGCSLTDLSSRNGTFLNGAPVKTSPLVNGDRIGVGDCEIVFAITDTVRVPGSTATESFEKMLVEPAPELPQSQAIPPPPVTLMSVPAAGENQPPAPAPVADISLKVMVISLQGHLDANTVSDFVKGIDDLLDSGIRRIIVEMNGIRRVGVGGWQALIAQKKRITRAGGDLKLARLRRKVLGDLRALKLSDILLHYPSVKEAQKAFESPEP